MKQKMLIAEAEKKLINNPSITDIKHGEFTKGKRGQELERRIGLRNGSSLTDFEDGELKSFSRGQTIKIATLKQCLPEIIDVDEYSVGDSKFFEKSRDIIFVAYEKTKNKISGNLIGWTRVQFETEDNIERWGQILEDVESVVKEIRRRYSVGESLNTINGPNDLVQIRSADQGGTGNRILEYKGQQLYHCQMAFYFTGKFGRELIKKYFENA